MHFALLRESGEQRSQTKLLKLLKILCETILCDESPSEQMSPRQMFTYWPALCGFALMRTPQTSIGYDVTEWKKRAVIVILVRRCGVAINDGEET